MKKVVFAVLCFSLLLSGCNKKAPDVSSSISETLQSSSQISSQETSSDISSEISSDISSDVSSDKAETSSSKAEGSSDVVSKPVNKEEEAVLDYFADPSMKEMMRLAFEKLLPGVKNPTYAQVKSLKISKIHITFGAGTAAAGKTIISFYKKEEAYPLEMSFYTALDGTVTYDAKANANVLKGFEKLPQYDWLVIDYGDYYTGYNYPEMLNGILTNVWGLSYNNFETKSIDFSAVSPSSFAGLKGLSVYGYQEGELERLLSENNVIEEIYLSDETEDGLAFLSTKKSLKKISVSNTAFGEKNAGIFNDLPNLYYLDICYCSVSTFDLINPVFPKLKNFYVFETYVRNPHTSMLSAGWKQHALEHGASEDIIVDSVGPKI